MLLKANPKLSRQLALEGPQLLWRDRAAGGREGLLLTSDVCPSPSCKKRHVLLTARWVDDTLISAKLLRTKLVMKRRPRPGEATRPGFFASVNVDDGAVELRDKAPDPAALAWFKAEIDGELLAVLRARFEGARRRIREAAAAFATPTAPAPPLAPARVATGDRPGRNDPCPCGSGLKYKRCCLIRAA